MRRVRVSSIVSTMPRRDVERRGGVPPARRDFVVITLTLIVVDAVAAALLMRVYLPAREEAALANAPVQLSLLARDRQTALAAWVAERLADVELTQSILGEQGVDQRANALFDHYRDAYHYESALIVDDDGQVLLRRGSDATDLPTIVDFIRERPATAGGWIDFRRTAKRAPKILVGGRLGGARPATIVLVSDPYDYVYPLFNTATSVSRTVETNLIGLYDGWGVGLTPYRYGAPPPMTARVRIPPMRATQVLLVGERSIRMVDRLGHSVIGVVKTIPRTHWVVFAKIDHDEVIEGAIDETIRLGILFALASIIVAMVAFVILRSRRVHAMRVAEMQLARLYENTTSGILVMRVVRDERGKPVDHELLYMNPAAEAFFSVNAQAEIGKRSARASYLVWPADIRERNYEVALTGKAANYERFDERAQRWFDTRCFSPAPGQFAQVLTDVTERIKSEDSVRHLSARVLRVQDETQRRVARELHETVSQSLASLRMNLGMMERFVDDDGKGAEVVADSLGIVDDAMSEVRTVSYLLHPPMIDQAGLITGLRWYLDGFQQRSGITTTFEAPEDLGRLSQSLETTIFRIVQEGLTNVQRHSGSATARVLLRREGDVLTVQIADEGHGLPPRLRDDRSALLGSGVGVAGIHERVHELHGEMRIESSEKGTTLTITLPAMASLTGFEPVSPP